MANASSAPFEVRTHLPWRTSHHLVAPHPLSSLEVNFNETPISWERAEGLTWSKHASGAEGRGSSCGDGSNVTVSTWIENDDQRHRALVDHEACMRCTCTKVGWEGLARFGRTGTWRSMEGNGPGKVSRRRKARTCRRRTKDRSWNGCLRERLPGCREGRPRA